MAEDGGDTDEQATRSLVNSLLKKRSIWEQFDKWIDETPGTSRDQFEIVKSAMLLHCEYPAIMLNRIGEEEYEDEETDYNPKQQFINFVNIVHKTNILNASVEYPSLNVFTAISDIFSAIPEFRTDVGVINEFLKEKLSMMLDPSMGWNQLDFNVHVVRSVYWQLLFTLGLAPSSSDGQTESTMSYDENRPKLMFGSFILAVLVAMGYEHENLLVLKIPNILKVENVVDHLIMMVKSSHFRSLSQFFLVGLWILIKYKTQGNHVTVTDERIYSNDAKLADERKFQEQIADQSFKPKSNAKPTDSLDEIQREWETFAVALLKKGFLKPPQGFRFVQKGGRPRKAVIQARKRKIGAPVMSEDLEEPNPPPPQRPRLQLQTNRYQKKEKPPKSPVKKRDVRKSFVKKQQSMEHSYSMPSTSTAPPPRPRRAYPTAEEVGLGVPVYLRQAEMLKCFKEEVQRRRTEGCSENDRERVRNLVFEKYDEVHRLHQLANEAKPRVASLEQQAVLKRIRRNWRRRGSDECESGENEDDDDGESEEEDDNEEEEQYTPRNAKKSAKTPAKTTKKWKRRY